MSHEAQTAPPPAARPMSGSDMPRLQVDAGPSRKDVKDKIIERFEQKYIIHPRLVP